MKKNLLWISLIVLWLLGFNQAAVLDNAILWWYSRWLTIFDTISSYQPNNYMRRDEAAKLYSKFAKIAGKTEYTKSVSECQFDDLNDAHKDLKDIVVESCRLGLFQWGNWKFLPKNGLTNGQAVAVLIRIVNGRQSESWVTHRSDNYYKKANELWLLSSVEMNNKTDSVTRWSIANILFNARSYDSSSYNYDSDSGLLDWANRSRSWIDNETSLKIQWAIQKIDNMRFSSLCLNYPNYQYCADLWFTPTLVYNKEFWNQQKTFTNRYLTIAWLSNTISTYIRHEFLLKYYYGMIDTKQYSIAQKMQWWSDIKSLSWYQETYNDDSTISIMLPDQISQWNSVRYATEITCSSFKKIKQKFSSLFTYIWNNTYRFPVIISKQLSNNNIENSVYEIKKQITSEDKIVQISSELVWSYVLWDWSAGDASCK